MLVCRLGSATVAAFFTLLLALAPRAAIATQKWGPVQLSGNLQTTNLIRHPDADHYEYVQNRNVARIKLEYKWLEAGKFYNKYEIPFIESSNLFIFWRGVYDSVYDTTPGFVDKEDIHGHAYGGLTVFELAHQTGRKSVLKLDGLSHEERDALKFDNQLREAYADIRFRGIPLTIRAGRQQIVWGETDNFRMLDRANSLDLTWHFQQEIPPPAFGWDEIRRPYWMLKFLYDLGDVGMLSQSFLEWYWNPGDWRPAKIDYLPRPWALRLLNPLNNPVDGGFIGGVCANSPVLLPNGLRACTRLANGTKLFQQGDYHRNPLENSQVGVRYHGIVPFGLEFTLNYIYQRWSGDDGTDFAPIRGLPKTFNRAVDDARFDALITKGIFPAEYIAPYVHTVGVSANYSDETYTQTLFRFETIYDVGIPFFDLAKITLIDNPSLPGVRKKNMWKGMIGLDRPTWIRPLNRRSTVFLSGQFFWHYLVNNPSCRAQEVAQLLAPQRAKVGSCLVGGLDLPSSGRNSAVSFRDKIRDWEALFTLAAFTFYRGGSVLPVAGMVVDPVNQFTIGAFWSLDYLVRDDFAVNLAQRYFITPRGHHTPIFDGWGLASMSTGRSETSLRFTYQF
jgi:hypothetical protein